MTTLELQGIAHELRFWRDFVKTDRFLKGWVGNCVTPELNHRVYDFIHGMLTQHPDRSSVKVLDVGSGVVSILNGLVPQANLTAVDPLGELYEFVFDYGKYRIKPPIAMPAEEIGADNLYDIVHISNALDHCQDPMKAYENLFAAVAPGGFLIIQGFENEADYEKWAGFHQWNISLNECMMNTGDQYSHNMLRIDGKNDSFIIKQCHYSWRGKLDAGKDWFIFIQQKKHDAAN